MTDSPAAVMPVPGLDVAAARIDAERLRRVARLCALAAERVDRTAPSQWYGGARTEYDAARAELARCVDDVRRLSRSAAEAVAVYADAVAPMSTRMHVAAADLEGGLRLKAADPASVRGDALVEHAWRDYDAAQRGYRAAVHDAVDALSPMPNQVSPAAQGWSRHVEAGTRTLWQDAVAGPVSLVWDLTGGLFEDRDAWWATVSAIPGAIADVVRHPLHTADEAIAGPQWRAGEWGAAVGATLALGSPGAPLKGFRAASNETLAKHVDNLADPKAPRPRLQTIEEMFVRVNLHAHEHHELGHTIRRHVTVTDDYLEDRLRNGTLLDEGVLGRPPRSGKASAWNDLDTAEQWITDTLKVHEKRLREWAVNPTTDVLPLEIAADPSVGRVMTLVDGEPQLSAPTLVKVVLMKDTDGVFIRTAYPDMPNQQRMRTP